MERDTGLDKAIRAVGTAAELARRLSVTPQAIDQWERIPLGRVFEVERATGVPHAELRPDFFGQAQEPA